MNERIRELMIKSGAFDHYEINEGVDGDELPMEKFAKLIIEKCGDIADNSVDHGIPSAYIDEYFGV